MSRRTNIAAWSDKRGSWRVDVQKDGVRRSFYSSTPGRTGQREANAKADAWLDNGIKEHGVKVGALYLVFQEESRVTVGTSEYSHIVQYGKNWILPNIGMKKAVSLTDGDVQKILDLAAGHGLSKKTIQGINGIINKFLKWCRRNKFTAYRPDDVHIPASARLKGKKVLQPSDLSTLLTVDTTVYKGKKVKEELIHAYRFQVLTGLRPGELRGLRIEDIEGDRVSVRRSINVYGEETRGKNENALRSFVLSPYAKKELAAQLEEYPSKSGFVFDLPSNVAYRERWKKFCEVHGMTVTTPYELRHTFVSVVKQLPAGEVKQLVGHSQNMDTFGTYGHALDGEDARTAEKIGGLFQQLVEPKEPA